VSAQVDAVKGEVTAGGRTWRFDLDCQQGTVAVDFEGGRVRLHPHSWKQKRLLARFSHLGEGFLHDQLVRSCLEESGAMPADGLQREALLALALWLNAPGGEPPLPLDQHVLATVTVQVCHSMQSTPAALDGLDAVDVELLWRAARGDAEGPPEDQPASTRVLIVPDHAATPPPVSGSAEPAQLAAMPASRPEGTAADDTNGRPAIVAFATPAATPAAPPLAETTSRPAPAPVATWPPSRDKREAAPGGSPLPRGGRFRVSLGTLAPSAPPATAPAIIAPAHHRDTPAPTAAAASASLSRSWPWPVTAASAAPRLAALDGGAGGTAAPQVLVAPPSRPERPADGGVLAGPEPAARVLALADDLFDELSVRLEQAAAELGIDLDR